MSKYQHSDVIIPKIMLDVKKKKNNKKDRLLLFVSK